MTRAGNANRARAVTHVEFLSTLPAETRASLIARSAARGLWHLAGHAGAIVLTGGLIASGVPGWWLLLPVQGALLVFLFTLEHECTHRTPFASDDLCDRVGQVCGFVLINPFLWFRYFHLAHHRFTNLEGQDPELAGPKPQTRAHWAWHVSGLPLWGASIRTVFRLAFGREHDTYVPQRARAKVTREARGMVLLYAAAGLSLWWSDVLLWVWIVPVLMGQPLLRLYLLAEHGDCPHVVDMFANTRTTFTTALVRFLAWNMPYHVEHHVFPNVPFHNLPRLHGLIRDHLQVTSDGYVAFTREYLARRR
ncbi:fatty acid desaturase [Pararhodobacter sp.]|uniref:fatty acid desaturase n=1 Tax=Pararhodobacter sp. TaxID=2127056 RepID=UPI002AFF1AEB|nr:fatty acid desaturase [Pararhodobacter sp.]